MFSNSSNKFDNRYQVLAIVGDNSKELDDNNPLLNPTNIKRGANHLAEGDTTESLANREKIRLSAEDWNTIKVAVEHGTDIPTDCGDPAYHCMCSMQVVDITPMKHRLTSITSIRVVQQKHRRSKVGA
jgi:hypothetical protein